MRSNDASTSATVSAGSRAGAGTSRSIAHPTPIWRWRNSPDRNATPASASSGERRRSTAAMRSIFSRRERVAPTASEASTSSVSSTP
jgi:hypothetical protein